MKNSTRILFLFILLCSINVSAGNGRQDQGSSNNFIPASQIGGHPITINTIVPFYTEDFAGGIPSGWVAYDSTSNVHNWRYTTTGSFTGMDSLSVSGTTASNGYMIYDSDSAQGHLGIDNATLTSIRIDCSTHPNVHLNFNEFIRYYNDTTAVYVSNDGVNWTFLVNESANLSQYQSTANPNNVDIDISSVAAGQDSVYIRFYYKADFSFYWMIDDVILHEVPSIEGSVTNITSPGTSCTLLGTTEAVIVDVFNSGGSDIVGGFDLTYEVDGGTPVTEHITDTVATATTYSYTFTGLADFASPGTHSITAYLTLTGDTIASNDTITTSLFNGPYVIDNNNTYSTGFEVTDDFSRWTTEDGNVDATSWVLDNFFPRTGTFAAQITSVTANDWLITTCFDLDASLAYKLDYYYRKTSSATQAALEVKIGNSPTSGGLTQELVPSGPINTLAYLPESVTFNVPTSGTYYIGFHVTSIDSLVGLCLDDILISTDSAVGVSTIERNQVNIYPNPSTGVMFINSKQHSSSGYTVEIISTMGQLISSNTTSALVDYEIDLSSQPSGIYIVRVISNNGILTRQVSVSH